jgi:signal transduction histidine kinase
MAHFRSTVAEGCGRGCGPVRAAAFLLLLLASAGAVAAQEARQAAPAGQRPVRILMLQGFGTDFDPYSAIAAAFRAGFSASWGGAVEFYDVPFEVGRTDTTEDDALFTTFLKVLQARRPVDLVVAIAAPAAEFALRQREEAFPGTPILLAGVDRQILARLALGPRDVAVEVALDVPGMVGNILQVLPGTRTVAVVLGVSPLERFWRRVVAREFAPYEDRVRFLWLDELPLSEMLRRVAELPPDSAVLFTILAVDTAGVPHVKQTALAGIVAAANAPVFGIFDLHLGKGIVGGALLPTAEVSRRAVESAIRILRGEPPAVFEPIGPGAPRYDSRQLRRWQISEDRLPPGSSVEFREPSAWREVLWPLLGGLLLLALETLLIVSLLVQLRRHRAAREEVRALNGRLIAGGEEERRRLARELHDDLSQRMARLAIDASLLEHAAPASGGAGAAAIGHELSRLSADLHAISHRLHPSILHGLGLEEALRAEGERFAQVEGIAVDLDFDRAGADLPQEVALSLFRVAQESMRNVAKHARASRLGIQLRDRDGGVELRVSDDGRGFDPGRSSGGGLGLISMRERLELVGGRLRIESLPGSGTSVRAWAPRQEAVA